MRKYAADNLLFLRDQYPEIYRLVRNKVYDKDRLAYQQTKSGNANVLIKDRTGSQLSLYSQYNPVLEASRWVDLIEADKHSNVVFCGFGLGYHLEAYMERYPERKVYLYEPDLDLFILAIETVDLRKVLGNKQIAMFALGSQPELQLGFIRETLKSIGSFSILIIPPYKRLLPELETDLSSLFHKAIYDFRSTIRTLTHFQTEFIENTLMNIRRNLNSFSFRYMKNCSRGIPAIIVGSGPSLGMQIEELRRLKGKALIIAAGSSVQSLLYHKIEPDLVVSMDPGKFNNRIFKTLNMDGIPLLYIPTMNYTAFTDSMTCLLHAFFTNDSVSAYLMDLDERAPGFDSTATVTGTAIQAAVYLGCNEIVFIGQDFSFPNSRFYSDGVVHASEKLLNKKLSEANRQVENMSGGFNPTTLTMLNLKFGIEDLIERLRGIAFFNASKIGAVIRNVQAKGLDVLASELEMLEHKEERWFYNVILDKSKSYPREYQIGVMNKVKRALASAKELGNELSLFHEHLLNADINLDHEISLQHWLNRFDQLWGSLNRNIAFKNILLFALQRELHYLQRSWPEVASIEQLSLKVAAASKSVLPLVLKAEEILPRIEDCLGALIEESHVLKENINNG